MMILDVIRAMTKARVPFAIVGGYALALHGIVRATMNIDCVVRMQAGDLSKAEAALKSLGMISRIPVQASELEKFRNEYVARRNLRAWSFVDPKDPTRQVDILVDRKLSDIKVQRVTVGGLRVPVATLESLLKMKLESNRPQDRIDVERIREKIAQKGKA